MNIQVVVGNVGTVYDGDDAQEAMRIASAYTTTAYHGRADGTVCVWRDGELVIERTIPGSAQRYRVTGTRRRVVFEMLVGECYATSEEEAARKILTGHPDSEIAVTLIDDDGDGAWHVAPDVDALGFDD